MIGPSVSGRAVPALAREIAGRLSALFDRDVEIVRRLNGAQHCLQDAIRRLWSGVSPDVFGVVCDGAAITGSSSIASLMADTRSTGGLDTDSAVLAAPPEIHWQVHRAFHAYQRACEERRQLAFDVGELSRQLTDVLCAAGWSRDEARRIDVHTLASAGSDQL